MVRLAAARFFPLCWYFSLGYRGTLRMMTSNNPKPNFLTLPTGEQIAYHRHLNQNADIGVLFLCGFRSSMDGNKALHLEEFCRTHLNTGFTRFDYRGHGESEGSRSFETLGLSDWIADARAMLLLSAPQPQILVGSSMGAWIALQLALEQQPVVAGILGIAAAPDFTVDVSKGFTLEQQRELQETQRVLLLSEYSNQPYPFSRHLLEDANQHLLLSTCGNRKSIDTTQQQSASADTEAFPNIIVDIKCPVRLIHGKQDVDVSWEKSLQLVDAIASDDVQLTLIKSGDHRLSTSKDLDIVCRVLEELVDTVRQTEP